MSPIDPALEAAAVVAVIIGGVAVACFAGRALLAAAGAM